MADQKPTSTFYNLLGGVNLKASEYSVQKSQFLDIRNMDFDVPNALQKRPGSTQAIGANTSGPISSLFEYIRLDGASFIVAGSDTAMFYLTGTSLTSLSPTWTNGQPTDMLTFVNRLFMANGQKHEFWSGPGSTAILVGMPCPVGTASLGGGADGTTNTSGATTWLVAGVTHAPSSARCIGLIVSYAYIRNDGAISSVDLPGFARNVVNNPAASNGRGLTLFYMDNIGQPPPGYGISGLAILVSLYQGTTIYADSVLGGNKAPSGVGSSFVYSNALLATANVNNIFYLYTLTSYTGASIAIELPDWSQFLGGAPTLLSLNNYCPWGIGRSGFFQSSVTIIPKYIEQNQNVYFMAGFSAAPSTVWFSEIGQPEQLQPDYNIEVRTNDGDRVTALKAYNNNLIVLKEQSFHKIIGDSPDNYELVELSTEYGCISNQAVVEYKEKLLWLDRKGIVEYNGASWDIISTAVEDIFRRMNLSAAREKAVAVHHLYRNQIWWGIPIDGSSVNNFTVVFDYFVGAWTFFDGFNPASFAFIKGALTQPTVWRGDYSGMIYYHSASFYGDNGVGISCVATPHWEKNKENETWIWRRFFLDVATASGLTGTITGRVYSNYNLSSVQATFSMFQDAFQSRAEIGVVGKAATVEWSHFSASLPLLINGYSWAKRFLRNV